MKILVLSPYPEQLLPALSIPGDEIVVSTATPAEWPDADFIVSYGYRTIIDKLTLLKYKSRIINLHISALPWNRGADPNFWSWFDETPKGVSIHEVDEGIDTGPVYGVSQIRFKPDHTLRSSYDVLQRTAALFFFSMWPQIRTGDIEPKPQIHNGSYHRSADKNKFFSSLPNGFDTPVTEVERIGRIVRGASVTSISAGRR